MVTRMPTRQPAAPAVRLLATADVRDTLARCLYDGPGDPLAPDATDHRPDDMRMSGIQRGRDDRMLAGRAEAGLTVTHDGQLQRVA